MSDQTSDSRVGGLPGPVGGRCEAFTTDEGVLLAIPDPNRRPVAASSHMLIRAVAAMTIAYLFGAVVAHVLFKAGMAELTADGLGTVIFLAISLTYFWLVRSRSRRSKQPPVSESCI